MSHEERLRDMFGESDEKPFSSKLQIAYKEHASSKRKQGEGKEWNQNYSRENRGRGRGRFDKINIQCYHCNKYGHFARECKLKEGNNNRSANYGNKNEEASHSNLFLSFDKAENSPQEVWYLDSGCSNHMLGNNELFSTMDENFQIQN